MSTRLTAATTELTIQMASRLLIPGRAAPPARGRRRQAEAQIVQRRPRVEMLPTTANGARVTIIIRGVGQNVVEDDAPRARPWARAAIT